VDFKVTGSIPANEVIVYDLMRSNPTNDGDHARGRNRYCRVTRSVLTALSLPDADDTVGFCCCYRRCGRTASCLLLP
jgi:hypothetical protein